MTIPSIYSDFHAQSSSSGDEWTQAPLTLHKPNTPTPTLTELKRKRAHGVAWVIAGGIVLGVGMLASVVSGVLVACMWIVGASQIIDGHLGLERKKRARFGMEQD